jgi:hypothetical protein
MPIERWALEAEEIVLFVPVEAEESLQALLALAGKVCGEMMDRWRAYHGEPPAVIATPDHAGMESAAFGWGRFEIEGARLSGAVVEGEALMRPNRLAGAESRLCRLANGDADRLWRLCKTRCDVDLPGPVCVGVDEAGMYVRGRLGTVRVAFDAEAADAGEAERALREMLERAR